MPFPFAFWKAAVAGGVPVVSAVSYGVVDTAGGGQRVVVTVNNSTGCTAISAGAVAFTSFAIDDGTHVSGIPGAHPGTGAVDVVVTNATGPSTTGTGLIEYWTPIQISGISCHLDANKGVTGGAAVSTWLDQSASGSIFTQATGANKPAQTASQFGTLPSIRFTPQQYVTASSRVALASGLSAFWVAKYTSARTTVTNSFGATAITVVSDNVNGYTGIGNSAGQIAITDDGSSQTLIGSGFNDGNPRLLGVTHDTGGTITAYSGTSSQGTGSQTYSTTFAGYDTVGDGYAWTDGADGDYGAVVIVSGIISGGDLTKLNNWSKQRWGTP